MTAHVGDTVTLPCSAPANTNITVWLKDAKTVCVNRKNDSQCEKDDNLPDSFIGRVELKNASMVMKNLMDNDTGTYQCQVAQGGTQLRTINTTHLKVEQAKDGGDEATDDGNKITIIIAAVVGVVVGVVGVVRVVCVVGVVGVVGVVVVVRYRKRKRSLEHSYQKPAYEMRQLNNSESV